MTGGIVFRDAEVPVTCEHKGSFVAIFGARPDAAATALKASCELVDAMGEIEPALVIFDIEKASVRCINRSMLAEWLA